MRESGTERTIDHVAVQFEASVVEHEINTPTLEGLDNIPDAFEMVPKDVLLCGSQSLPTSRLQLFDILFGHLLKLGQ